MKKVKYKIESETLKNKIRGEIIIKKTLKDIKSKRVIYVKSNLFNSLNTHWYLLFRFMVTRMVELLSWRHSNVKKMKLPSWIMIEQYRASILNIYNI